MCDGGSLKVRVDCCLTGGGRAAQLCVGQAASFVAGSVGCLMDTLHTIRVCAVCWLSLGCSSGFRGWQAAKTKFPLKEANIYDVNHLSIFSKSFCL